MKRFPIRLFAALFSCFLFALLSAAQAPQRDFLKEEQIHRQLYQISPESLGKFKAATVALDSGNDAEAAKLYKEVLVKAPNFEPALRRAGMALVSLDKRDEGLKLLQKAVSLNRSPENLISHAFALTSGGTNQRQPNQADFSQALALAKEAMLKNTDDEPDYALSVAQFALYADQMDDFKAAVVTLQEKFPKHPATHYFASIRLANDGDFSAAEVEIQKAEELGLPGETAQGIRAGIETAKSESWYYWKQYFLYSLYAVAAWALGLIALFVAGKILSAQTLRSVENSDPNDITGGGQAGLRKVYKNLISAAGVYYFLSQPVVMFLVVALTGGIILFFLWVGRIPIKLVAILAVVGLATIFYMIKSFFVRAKDEDPGRILTEAEAPGLWALARDVAKTLDTRPVTEIRITHGTEMAVYERGGLRAKMRDEADRVLIMGVAVLNDFQQNAFRAVLAHEYGHFSNRDTAGGDVAMRVNRHIVGLAVSMGESGTATFYNVAFQFLRLYHFLFRRITHGATRLQEILADRVAVHLYGADAFREGLTHVIRRDVEFSHVAEKEINAAFGSNRALQNLYEMSEQDEGARKNLQQQFNEIVNRPTTEDDTHPSPRDRFRLASRIKSRECAPLPGEVWDLFRDRAALTAEMNASLEKALRASV